MKKIIILCVFSLIAKLSAAHPLATDSNAFAITFYQQGENSPNRCFSPYSIFRALSGAYLGAQDKTAEQMEQTLQLSNSALELPSFFNSLQETLKLAGVKTTDTLWVQTGTLISQDYQISSEEMGSDIKKIDFSQKIKAVNSINEQISNATNGLIPKLLSETDITAATQMVLTNTVFFEGNWTFPFLPELTNMENFYGETNTFIVPMMYQSNQFSYYENTACQLVLLPIANSSCSCFFILPKKSMQELEDSLSNLPVWIKNTRRKLVDLELPRFQVRQTLKLKDVLCKMGMEEPFSPTADFSNILLGQKLRMEQVLHEAFFSIEEKGVKAGAATAISMAKSCAIMKRDPISFIANRPFLFGIVDENSKIVLFLGKLSAF